MLIKNLLPTVTAALNILALTCASPVAKRGLAFDYNNEKVRGVNLGGWFVLEPWIRPSLFEEWANTGRTVVDEYTYTQTLGKAEAFSRLNSHWNSWITQGDFVRIAAAGMNHVRIPLGYWAAAPLDGDPYVQGQLPVLDNAVNWARAAGIKIVIDLHGAPGSQNGFDNSGRFGNIGWLQGDTVAQTLNAINALTQRYAGDSDTVTAIQLLNEPLGAVLDLNGIRDYFQRGYDTVRQTTGNIAVVLQDAFEDFVGYWNGFLNTQSGAFDVIMGTHQYQIFSHPLVSLSPSDHVSAACALGERLPLTDKWTWVGEWTGAQTDCARWLNGLGLGARYDGTLAGNAQVGSCDGKYTGTVDALSSDDKSNLRHFIEAQLDAYERHTGWIFWTWKTESAPEWDMQALLAGGLFPQPLDSRQYPKQCNY